MVAKADFAAPALKQAGGLAHRRQGATDLLAGAGLYRLDGDYASTSGEAGGGILRLTAAGVAALTPALQAYVDMVKAFNQGATTKVYPGSPFIIQRLLREHDKLKLFELHPTDLRALAGNVAQLEAGRQVAVLPEAAHATEHAQQLLAALAAPLPTCDCTLSASIGMACAPTDGHDAQTLVQHADLAMYAAKRNGRNQLQRWPVAALARD